MAFSKTIIVSRTDKIGDFIVSIPSFATLKAMLPECRLVALVSNHNKIIAQSLDCIDEVVSIDDFSEKDLVTKLRSFNAEYFVALVSNNFIAKLAFKSGAKKRIGPLSKPLSFIFFNKGIRQHRSKSIKSEAEYNLDLIAKIDPKRFSEVGVQFASIKFSEEDEHIISQFLEQESLSDKNFMIFNPFSGGSGTNLPFAKYGEIINQIIANAPNYRNPFQEEQHDLQGSLHNETQAINATLSQEDLDCIRRHAMPEIVILGLPQHEPLLNEIMLNVNEQARPYVHILLNQHSLLVAAALVYKCKFFIGPSTGITHIAGNYKKPVICFYSTRKSNCHVRWELYGDHEEVAFSFKEEQIDPITHEVKDLSESSFQAIVSTALEEFYRY